MPKVSAKHRRWGDILKASHGIAFFSATCRAQKTALLLARCGGIDVTIDSGLHEGCYGVLEGLRYEDAAERYPQAYAALMARDLDARFPAGVHVAETVREFSERTVNTLLRLLGSGSFRRIAVVSHGGVLDYIYRFAKNLPLDQPRSCDVFNASINRLTWCRE